MALVQPFSLVWQAEPSTSSEGYRQIPGSRSRSLGLVASQGSLPQWVFQTIGASHLLGYKPGYAWAARYDVLATCGFYDALVVGGGDKAMAATGLGKYGDIIKTFHMSKLHADHFGDWARRFYEAIRGHIGCTEGDLLHLWHGDTARRARNWAYNAFTRFEFDPKSDIAISRQGAWRWNTQKTALHEHVEAYLRWRAEDSDSQGPTCKIRGGTG
jgi:hypothetical protein